MAAKYWSYFLFAKDVMEILQVSRTTAYKIIKSLNKELQEMGKCTFDGRVPRSYFEERYYCMDTRGSSGKEETKKPGKSARTTSGRPARARA